MSTEETVRRAEVDRASAEIVALVDRIAAKVDDLDQADAAQVVSAALRMMALKPDTLAAALAVYAVRARRPVPPL